MSSSFAARDSLHGLYKGGLCAWPSCGTPCGSYSVFLTHLFSAHAAAAPLTLHDVRIKGLVVSQLRAQVAEEEATLGAMLNHLRAGDPDRRLQAQLNQSSSQRHISLSESVASSPGGRGQLASWDDVWSGESRRSSGALTIGSVGEDEHPSQLRLPPLKEVEVISVKLEDPQERAQPHSKLCEREPGAGLESPAKSDPEDYTQTAEQMEESEAAAARPASLAPAHLLALAHGAPTSPMMSNRLAGNGTDGPAGSSRTRGSSLTEDLAANRAMYRLNAVRPPHSYAALIRQAITESRYQQRTLQDIYQWFTENFAWFRAETSQQWKNAIRHNLSLQRCFKRTNDIKGSYWIIDYEEQGIKKRKRKVEMGGFGKAEGGGLEAGFLNRHSAAFPLPLIPAADLVPRRASVGVGLEATSWRSVAAVADSIFSRAGATNEAARLQQLSSAHLRID